MTSLLKLVDLSQFFEKHAMWRYETSMWQIFIKLLESVYFHEILNLSKFQVNLIILTKLWVYVGFLHISHYFGMFRYVDGHILQKNDQIDSKFAQVQDFSKLNIFWDFSENPTAWRHLPSSDVIGVP